MNFTTRKPVQALCLIPLAALWLSSASVQAQSTMPMATAASAPKGGMQSGMMESPDMKQSMQAGMDGMQKMQMTGDHDVDFAMMMKMHHEGAITMAESELKMGKHRQMKKMAKDIIAAQKKEIEQFDKFLANHKK